MKNDYREIMNEFPLSLYDTDDQTISKDLTWIKGPVIRFGELSNHTQFIYQNKILMKIDQYNACTISKRNRMNYLFNQKDLVHRVDFKNDPEIQSNVEKIRVTLDHYSSQSNCYCFHVSYNNDFKVCEQIYINKETCNDFSFQLSSFMHKGKLVDSLKIKKDEQGLSIHWFDKEISHHHMSRWNIGDSVTIMLSNIQQPF